MMGPKKNKKKRKREREKKGQIVQSTKKQAQPKSSYQQNKKHSINSAETAEMTTKVVYKL